MLLMRLADEPFSPSSQLRAQADPSASIIASAETNSTSAVDELPGLTKDVFHYLKSISQPL